MVIALSFAAVLVALVVAVWFGNHTLRNPGPTSSGGNAFGGFDVFDPGQGRMKEELDSKETEGQMFAAPERDTRPQVDLRANTIRIRKPPPPAD